MRTLQTNHSGNERWILGFDGGCTMCNDLPGRIDVISQGTLTVRNLRDPELGRWRRKAFGESTPWEPALFLITEDGVQGWTGRGMVVQLGRLLGPTKAWQVARILGDVVTPSSAANHLVGRRGFIKQLGGVALAAAFLVTGKMTLPTRVTATDSSRLLGSELQSRGQHEITGQQKASRLHDIVGRSDVKKMVSDLDLEVEQATMVRHDLAASNELLAVSWAIAPDRVLAFYSV